MEVEVEVMDDERLKGEERIFPSNSPTFWSCEFYSGISMAVINWNEANEICKCNVNNFDV